MRVLIVAIPLGASLPPMNPRYMVAGMILPAIRSGNGYRVKSEDVVSLLQGLGANKEAEEWRSQSAKWPPEIREQFVVDEQFCHIVDSSLEEGVKPNITSPSSEELLYCSDCVCPFCRAVRSASEH